MAKLIRPPGRKGGVKTVAKIRRTREQAYGTRAEWAALVAAVKKRDGYKCVLCPCTQYLQVDHIIPVARGGLSIMKNLWTLCDICHSKRPGHKSAKHLILHKRNSANKKGK